MDEERQKSSPLSIILIVVLLASVPLYVASTGPAVWLCSQGTITKQQLFTAYAPIAWLEMRSPAFSRVLEAYIGLWAPNGPHPQPAATPIPALPGSS